MAFCNSEETLSVHLLDPARSPRCIEVHIDRNYIDIIIIVAPEIFQFGPRPELQQSQEAFSSLPRHSDIHRVDLGSRHNLRPSSPFPPPRDYINSQRERPVTRTRGVAFVSVSGSSSSSSSSEIGFEERRSRLCQSVFNFSSTSSPDSGGDCSYQSPRDSVARSSNSREGLDLSSPFLTPEQNQEAGQHLSDDLPRNFNVMQTTRLGFQFNPPRLAELRTETNTAVVDDYEDAEMLPVVRATTNQAKELYSANQELARAQQSSRRRRRQSSDSRQCNPASK